MDLISYTKLCWHKNSIRESRARLVLPLIELVDAYALVADSKTINRYIVACNVWAGVQTNISPDSVSMYDPWGCDMQVPRTALHHAARKGSLLSEWCRRMPQKPVTHPGSRLGQGNGQKTCWKGTSPKGWLERQDVKRRATMITGV